jgi:hypothetical protein
MVVLRRAMLGAGAHRDPVLPSYRGTTTRKRSSSAPGPLPHLSNRVFASYTDLVDHCCVAWNKLIERPWTIMSIGLRDWANGF